VGPFNGGGSKAAYRDLTRGNSATVAEVAERWGFSDLSSFSRAFRQEFGVTAKDVRARSSMPGAPMFFTGELHRR